MSVPDNGGLSGAHARPAFERRMVLVDRGLHHPANVECFLSAGVGLVGKDVADTSEAFFPRCAVRVFANVAVDWVAGCGGTRESFAAHDVSVFVMRQQDVASLIDVTRPVLGLPVQAHDAVISADPKIVFSGNAA